MKMHLKYLRFCIRRVNIYTGRLVVLPSPGVFGHYPSVADFFFFFGNPPAFVKGEVNKSTRFPVCEISCLICKYLTYKIGHLYVNTFNSGKVNCRF